jgi:hypothetical protein
MTRGSTRKQENVVGLHFLGFDMDLTKPGGVGPQLGFIEQKENVVGLHFFGFDIDLTKPGGVGPQLGFSLKEVSVGRVRYSDKDAEPRKCSRTTFVSFRHAAHKSGWGPTPNRVQCSRGPTPIGIQLSAMSARKCCRTAFSSFRHAAHKSGWGPTPFRIQCSTRTAP